MSRIWGTTLASFTIALLLPVTAWATISQGSPDDWLPSLVYNPADGSLTIDTGAGHGGPDPIYYVTVYSEYGIFDSLHASPYFVWYATDDEITTLQTEPLYDGDIIGDPGFMYRNEQLSFLLDDLTFIWQDDPFAGQAYYGDLVYLSDTPPLPGDLDGDAFVGITDLNVVLGKWNQAVSAGDLLQGDPSGDGFVGIEDLNVVLSHWNTGSPPANAAPEPATAAILTFALTAGLSQRRRR